VAARVAARVLADGLPPGVFLNVNVPKGTPRGIRVTRQGTRTYRAAAIERLDPAGRPYFWIAGADTAPSHEEDGDHAAIRDGFVSITPLHADMTHEPSRRLVAAWGLALP
jgi:5'-nucleotidase